MPNEPMQYRKPKHEYTVDDDGGQQLTDEQLRQEFEEWVAHCESNKKLYQGGVKWNFKSQTILSRLLRRAS
jgi:hypothetical protein